jgi:predicted acylesterase/phospholipase RssA
MSDGARKRRGRGAGRLALAALAVVLTGCTTVLVRSPVPAELIGSARPYGIESSLIRAWGDTIGDAGIDYVVQARAAALRRVFGARIARGQPLRSTALALSGGGADGAFGAGLLAGWTARGDRPEFQLVSGISTGAIIGFFAFLGPAYDDVLREIYTTHVTRDLLTPTILTGLLRGTALSDTSGFRNLINTHVDRAALRAVARAHAEGRLLFIGTTNLDATRPVIWNIGEIAASGHPAALNLVRDVIQASSAIPGAFPPVLIPVKAGGRRYDEMHVDGGATRQVMLFSPELPVRRIDEALGVEVDRTLYVIVNNRLIRPYRPVAPRLRPIALTSISSLIAGSGTGDVFQLFAVAERDRVPIRITWIPESFDLQPREAFDRRYMRALYDLGFETGRTGVDWRRRPPHFPSRPPSAPEPRQAGPSAGGPETAVSGP